MAVSHNHRSGEGGTQEMGPHQRGRCQGPGAVGFLTTTNYSFKWAVTFLVAIGQKSKHILKYTLICLCLKDCPFKEI